MSSAEETNYAAPQQSTDSESQQATDYSRVYDNDSQTEAEEISSEPKVQAASEYDGDGESSSDDFNDDTTGGDAAQDEAPTQKMKKRNKKNRKKHENNQLALQRQRQDFEQEGNPETQQVQQPAPQPQQPQQQKKGSGVPKLNLAMNLEAEVSLAAEIQGDLTLAILEGDQK